MDWFKRYGIVGGYFCGMFAVWFLLFFPNILNVLMDKNSNTTFLFALWGISFLPIGYLITISEQLIYLMTPWFGVITPALGNFDKDVPEWMKEAYEAIESIKGQSTDKQQIIRHWVSNRQDVMTINGSIIVSTVFIILLYSAFLCVHQVFAVYPTYIGNKFLISISYIIAFPIIVICSFSFCIQRKQVIIFIKGWREVANEE